MPIFSLCCLVVGALGLAAACTALLVLARKARKKFLVLKKGPTTSWPVEDQQQADQIGTNETLGGYQIEYWVLASMGVVCGIGSCALAALLIWTLSRV